MNTPLSVLFVANPDRFLTKEESLHIESCERLCKNLGEISSELPVGKSPKLLLKCYPRKDYTNCHWRKPTKSLETLLRRSFTQQVMELIRHNKSISILSPPSNKKYQFRLNTYDIARIRQKLVTYYLLIITYTD